MTEEAGPLARHPFVKYPDGSTFDIVGRSCVKCGLPPENPVHDTDDPPAKIEVINPPERLFNN